MAGQGDPLRADLDSPRRRHRRKNGLDHRVVQPGEPAGNLGSLELRLAGRLLVHRGQHRFDLCGQLVEHRLVDPDRAGGRNGDFGQLAPIDQRPAYRLHVVDAGGSGQVGRVPFPPAPEVDRRRSPPERIVRPEIGQPGQRPVVAAAELGGVGVEHVPSADGEHRRFAADHHRLCPAGHGRPVEEQLPRCPIARLELVPIQQHHRGHQFGGAEVDPYAGAVFQSARGRRQQVQPHRQPPAGNQVTRAAQLVPAIQLLVMDAGQVDCRPLSAVDLFHGAAVVLQPPDADRDSSRFEGQFVAQPGPAAGHAAGHNRAVSGEGERAVDGHPERAAFPAATLGAGGLAGGFNQGGPQRVKPQPGDGTRADQGRPGKKRPGDQLANLLFHQLQPLRIDQVALGQRDHARGELQQPEDFQVFPGLRLDRVVGGHDQQGEVDPGGPGQHVPHEAFVAGHVDDPQPVVVQQQLGEAQLDGDSAAFLLRQAIGVDPGQGLHQCGLAVVDVPGGPQYQIDGHTLILGRRVRLDEPWLKRPPAERPRRVGPAQDTRIPKARTTHKPASRGIFVPRKNRFATPCGRGRLKHGQIRARKIDASQHACLW